MAVRRNVRLMGSIFLILFSFYMWDISKEKAAERIHQLQEGRKQLLRETCDGDKEASTGGKHSLEELRDAELVNFIVDDKHCVIYCYLPKVACTNWKRVFSVLGQEKPYPDLMSISGPKVHTSKNLTLLRSFPRQEMMAKLKHYTKFLFVRDPFVRLISAYRHKLQNNNEAFYRNFGRDILRRYGNHPNPPRTQEEAIEKGVMPSFHNFIQYLVDPQTEKNLPFNEHWRQMHRLCHPCLIQYDFVGHQETLEQDAEHLLKLLALEDDIKFPPAYETVTSTTSLLDWFSTVPLEDRRKLYKIYEKDFKLFGYRKPEELLDG